MTQDVAVKEERQALLHNITRLTDKVMVALAFVWIGLMIADFLGKSSRPLVILNYAIWGIFIADFLVKFWVAPHKARFVKSHWLTVISLVLPAFRVIRIFQALGALRALSLVRILTSLNRGMAALVEAMGKRGVGYIIVLTIIVLFAGAGGMYQFENPQQLQEEGFQSTVDQGGGLHSFSDAVWWTAMLMTTIGSQYWPVTLAGRVLCFLISMFSLGVFGYITATLASFFVDKDENKDAGAEKDAPVTRADIDRLHEDLARLHAAVARLSPPAS